ncbi:hypothetical protein ACF1FX_27055 [Streptomyces sp. NPDC014646]|uniref:hypothetical protein n=1 Tax=Streptomyces sp. NPDC014646 TaxID=3364877 RepID=UPI0036FFF38C
MTTIQRGSTGMTANPAQGVRINRKGPLRRTAAGRIALPLAVGKDGIHLAEENLVLTVDAALVLYDELWHLMGKPIPLATPDERDE